MIREKHSNNSSGRKREIRCVVFWTTFILGATLFPFDPVLGPVLSENLARFALVPIGNPNDFMANTLLFIPWSFSVAGMLTRNHSYRHRLFIVLILGIVLSGMVEFLQLGLPSRFPALADIHANLLGVVVGVWMETSHGKRLRSWLSPLSTHMTQILTIRILVGLMFFHMVLVWGLLQFADHQSSFSNWDPCYHLNLGNESTGDRPWTGSLGVVQLWKSILPQKEIDRMLTGEPPAADLGKDLLWFLNPSQSISTNSRFFQIPGMNWQPVPPKRVEQKAVELIALSEDHWLTSSDPFVQQIKALKQAGRFTLSVLLQTGNTSQTGPGRIVSLSIDPFLRNFTLGQEGPDLVFRLRTPSTGLNGSEPALIVANVFSEVKRRHIVVTYDGAILSVYSGSGESSAQLNLRYGGVFTGMGFRFNAADQNGYRVVFWGMVVIPFMYLLAVLFARVRADQGRQANY